MKILPSKKAIISKMLPKLVVFVLLAFSLTIFIVFGSFKDKLDVLFTSIVFVLVLLNLFDIIVFTRLQIKNMENYIDDDKISIKYGVIFKHYVEIPIVQIQDISENRNPADLLLHTAKLKISTAGSDQVMYGIDENISKELVSDIRKKVTERIEVYGK